MTERKIVVLWINRKKAQAFFSIEKVFKSIKPYFSKFEISEADAISRSASLTSIVKNGRFFQSKDADIYHITGDVHYAAFFLPGNRTILTIHDCVFLFHPNPVKRFILKLLWLRLPVRRVKFVTTISEKSKAEILRFSKCDPSKIIVVPDSVNLSFVPVARKERGEKIKILHIGIKPNKNLERVAQALNGIPCKLKIVGILTDKQIELLKSNNIDYTNSFNLTEEELIAIYQQSDLLLFATLYEGFGLPIIEAQSCGVPVITSNIEPMQSNAGAGALLVDPYSVSSIRSGVEQMIADADLRASMIEKGFKNVQRFHPSVIADAYADIYRKISLN